MFGSQLTPKNHSYSDSSRSNRLHERIREHERKFDEINKLIDNNKEVYDNWFNGRAKPRYTGTNIS